MLLAHGKVKQLSVQKYAAQKFKVGMALNVEWAEPMTPSGGWAGRRPERLTSARDRQPVCLPGMSLGGGPAAQSARAPRIHCLASTARAAPPPTREALAALPCASPPVAAAADKAAAQRSLDIQFGLFADPLFLGR